MTISFFRLGHLWLAFVSTIFLLIACITGVILSVEPAYHASKGLKAGDQASLPVATLIQNVSEKYSEILVISRDGNGFVAIETYEESFYINPHTGDKEADFYKTPEIFNFSRNLHRSLFMGSFGRFLMGITSIMLILSSISGIYLVIKKQGGMSKYFSSLVTNEFNRDNHTRIGRILLLTILVITVTGAYLFLERFEIIPQNNISHQFDSGSFAAGPVIPTESFKIFQETPVSELMKIEFPFSDDVADVFNMTLADRELLINQFTGKVESNQFYSTTKNLSILSFDLHTGEGNVIWGIILGLNSVGILFLIYSGYKIYFSRSRSFIKNTYNANDAEIVVLVGSEQGSTLRFAANFHDSLLNSEHKSYLTEMNNVENYSSMKYLVIFTSTYGAGEAPYNARDFMDAIKSESVFNKSFYYAVVGFGSMSYPHFCQFAYDVDGALLRLNHAQQLFKVHAVNDQSADAYHQWIKKFEQIVDSPLKILTDIRLPALNSTKFNVRRKIVSPNSEDATFLLELESGNGKMKKYKSGDLVGIKSRFDDVPRMYSVAILNSTTVLLSIRIHEKGIVSNYLNTLSENDTLSGIITHNRSFHFPKNARRGVIFISNGTGIAPFLGMIKNNSRRKKIHLYWGGRNELSYDLYRAHIEEALLEKKLTTVSTALSRQYAQKQYVQDLIMKDSSLIIERLSQGFHIMICGSITMRDGVLSVLSHICREQGLTLQKFLENGQIKSDCY